jgi:hypothetical protein
MQSIPVLRPNTDTINNVMQYYSKLRSGIDSIQNNAIIDIQNAVRSKIARTKVKSVIEERKKQSNDKRNTLIKNMQNTIMAQGVINELIDTAANKGESNKKQKAATKIQDAFKKLKAKNESKASSIRKLSRKRDRRLEDLQALNERLNLEQEALKRYSNDNPKKFVKMEIQIQKTIKQIEFYTKQINFLTQKIATL